VGSLKSCVPTFGQHSEAEWANNFPWCRYIYFQKTPFEDLPPDYQCPQCSAFKKRFAPYDPSTGKVRGSALPCLLLYAACSTPRT
jgi:hypothetical protein